MRTKIEETGPPNGALYHRAPPVVVMPDLKKGERERNRLDCVGDWEIYYWGLGLWGSGMLQVLGGLGCKNLDWVCLNIRVFLEIWFEFSGFGFFRFELGFFEFEFRVSDNNRSHEIPLGLNPVDLAVFPGTCPDSVHTMHAVSVSRRPGASPRRNRPHARRSRS